MRIAFSIDRQKPFPVVERRQAPGKISAKESEGVGPGPARYRIQTDTQTRQVLNAPLHGERMPQTNADQIDQAELMTVDRHN